LEQQIRHNYVYIPTEKIVVEICIGDVLYILKLFLGEGEKMDLGIHPAGPLTIYNEDLNHAHRPPSLTIPHTKEFYMHICYQSPSVLRP